MNILIPYSWVKEYLETKANPEKIGECLSLCGASVEKIKKVDNDFIYDIEVTTNRVDMMSILGIAREAAAILPQFGIKAWLKKDPYKEKLKAQNSKLKIMPAQKPSILGQNTETTKSSKLKIIIKNKNLCPRFTAILLDNIKIKPSPKIIQDRLKKVGIRSLNNIIDISNYLMHEFGQPVHVFDYKKIKGSKMIIRESKKGEKLTTLDGKTHNLAGGDLIIEDGKRRLIDLCGIMGGENSSVDSNTKKVLLFVQNYEPVHIRKTSMNLGLRTDASSLFEKKVDPELVMPTLLKGIQLIKKYADGKVSSKIIDIYPKPYKPKTVKVSLQLIEQYLGLPLQSNKVIKILSSLGFQIKQSAMPTSKSSIHDQSIGINNQQLTITVPSWRAQDISIPEDLIEEVARIYGYHNLPSILPPCQPPKSSPQAKEFYWESKIKKTLKSLGLTETYTYSMQSKEELNNFNLEPKNHLKIKNPLTEDWVYMRKSLLPSLLSVIKQNQNLEKEIKIFELANIYNPVRNELPDELLKLTIAFTGDKFSELKGICEALFQTLNIQEQYAKIDPKFDIPGFNHKTARILHKKNSLGFIGEIKSEILKNFAINEKVFIADLNFKKIANIANNKKVYIPIYKYPPIIEDMTFVINPKVYYSSLVQLIKSISLIIQRIDFIGKFLPSKSEGKNSLTIRITYQDPKKNLTDKEVGKIRKKIIAKLKKQNIILKGKIE